MPQAIGFAKNLSSPFKPEAIMVKKLQKSSSKQQADAGGTSPLASAVKDSAQQIWLAGLGAFAKAQQEGSKAFDSLVKEGLTVQRKTQAVAEERISDATSRMTSMANDITAKANGQWDKLESIFEDRVARTLNKLGVPSAQDIEALIARIDELNQNVQKLQPKAAPKAAVKAAPKVEVAEAEEAPAKPATPKRAPARKAAAATADKPAAAKRPAARKTAKAETAAADTTDSSAANTPV
jgi:poly(hydroxyalkanoate) granule-associated protein